MPAHPQPEPDDAPPIEQPAGIRLAPGLTLLGSALRFAAARSSGPGGQNVNKRATKVEMRLDLADLWRAGMSKAALGRLRKIASHQIVMPKETPPPLPRDPDAPPKPPHPPAGELVITSQDTRSQGQNRDACIERLIEIVKRALVTPKTRRPTKPGRGAIERRLKAKREAGQKKDRRRWRAD